MKKLLFISVATIVAATVVSSCQKREVKDDAPDVILTGTRTVTCSIADLSGPGTKMDINTNTGKTEWEEGDEILFHGRWVGESDSHHYSRIVKLSKSDISENKKSFTVTLESIENAPDSKWDEYYRASNLIVAYPADAVNITNVGDSWFGVNKYTTSNLPLLCGFNSFEEPDQFTLYNLCSIISFKVSGEFDGYDFSGNNSECVGYDSFNSEVVLDKGGSLRKKWAQGTELTEISGTLTADGATENLICIPSGANFSEGFNIVFKKGDEKKMVVSTKDAIDLSRDESTFNCKTLVLGDITSHLVTYTPPATHQATNPAITGATALDASENANCYVVDGSDANNANKVYKFKAYKGNSSYNVGVIKSVGILWQTYNNATAVTDPVISAVDFEKTSTNNFYEIVFKMPATLKAGNALIAAYDGDNQTGNILWSWHIWVPATPFTHENYDFKLALSDNKKYDLMSRNLGALKDTEAGEAAADPQSFGLLYQFGRKDPFLGANAVGSTTPVAYIGTEMTIETTPVDAAETVGKPTVFIGVDGAWCKENDNLLWGDFERSATTPKAVYDPCPPGYRVATRKQFAIFRKDGKAENFTNWDYSSANGFVKLGTPVTAFPICGYINHDGTYMEGAAIVWNSHNDFESETKSYSMGISNNTSCQEQNKRAIAGSVRCQYSTADAAD